MGLCAYVHTVSANIFLPIQLSFRLEKTAQIPDFGTNRWSRGEPAALWTRRHLTVTPTGPQPLNQGVVDLMDVMKEPDLGGTGNLRPGLSRQAN